jgi:hypothetical protein
MRNAYKIKLGNLKRRDHLRTLSVEGRIILKRIINKQGMAVWTGLKWLGICTSGEFQ